MSQEYQPYLQGVNTKVSDELKQRGELREGTNINLDEIGTIKKRTGYSQAGDTLQANKNVLGLFAFYPSTDIKYLIAATNNSADDSAVLKYRMGQNYNFTIQTIVGLEDAKFEFASFIDHCFGVGYDSTDDVFVTTFSLTNDLTYSTTTNVTDAPKGKYICSIHGYLLIANGEDEDGEAANSRVWWAVPPTTLPYSLNWDNDNNYWDFQPFDGDEITGIIPTSANRILVFKNYSIHSFEPVAETAVKISDGIGCSSPRTIKNVGNHTIFLGRKGVYATTGGEPTLISSAIQDYIDGINWDNVEDFCAGVRDDKYYHLFLETLSKPETLNKVELIYDVTQNIWTVNTLQNTIKVYCNYIELESPVTTSTSSSSSSSTSSSTSTT